MLFKVKLDRERTFFAANLPLLLSLNVKALPLQVANSKIS
jgi:hypothetical protein